MNKDSIIKGLENLFSWYELYSKLGTYNPKAVEQVQNAITSYKKQYDLK